MPSNSHFFASCAKPSFCKLSGDMDRDLWLIPCTLAVPTGPSRTEARCGWERHKGQG